ncbi:MAG TPA: flagellar biosynthetic protein FliQ, partial [Cellvibrionaceae bacterium]|nr:flagellar biosynthetic protein FliQ [Cellvibrionaceae bacterium]
EQTLSFLPRLIVTLLTIMATGAWMINKLMELFSQLMLDIPHVIG